VKNVPNRFFPISKKKILFEALLIAYYFRVRSARSLQPVVNFLEKSKKQAPGIKIPNGAHQCITWLGYYSNCIDNYSGIPKEEGA